MPSEAAEWSRPRLVEVNRGEPTEPTEPTEPEPVLELQPLPEPEAGPDAERGAEPSEPAAQQAAAPAEPEAELEAAPAEPAEPEAEPEAEPAEPAAEPAEPAAEPVPAAIHEPQFTSVPIAARHSPTQYPVGEVPPWQGKLVQRVAEVAVVAMPIPLRVLDVGCGDARLLAELILRVPSAELYVGLDPRRDAVPAELRATEPRLSVIRAVAEALPLPDASFDLVIASLSLTLWSDQRAGAAELARVVSDNGKVVVVELRKAQITGRNRVSGVKEITALLEAAGLAVERVETVHRSALGAPLAHAFIASP
jgi:SAM-dependent methyltransferase